MPDHAISNRPQVVPPHSPSPSFSPSTPPPVYAPLIPIDLGVALRSIIRAWLAIRDQAVVSFVAGTNPANRLETPRLDTPEMTDLLSRLQQLRETALLFAAQAAVGKETADEVLSREVDKVLETDTPMFLLHADTLPGSF